MVKGLFAEQKRLGEEIDRFKLNYQKDGKSRKNKVEYFASKLQSLASLFSEFQENNKTLETEFANKVQDADYFKNNYFEKVSEIYTSLEALIKNDLEEFNNANRSEDKEANKPVMELVDLTLDKDFSKKMLELLSVRIQKYANLDLKTWKFNMNRADHYWNDYVAGCAFIEENFKADYDILKLKEEQDAINDLYQGIAVLIEERLAAAEANEQEEENFNLNNTILRLNESLRSIKRDSNDDFKLPRIQVPKFNGSFIAGQNFEIYTLHLFIQRKTSLTFKNYNT